MASDLKKLRENIRAEWMDFLTEMVQRKGDETLLTASNEFAVPVVDHEGSESTRVFKEISKDDFAKLFEEISSNLRACV